MEPNEPAPAPRTSLASSELRVWLKLARSAAIGGGLLVVAFLLLEIVRAYLTLRELAPGLGLGFVLLLAGIVAWTTWKVALAWRQLPPVLSPPPLIDRQNPSARELRQYADYLRRFAERLDTNRELGASEREALAGVCVDLEGVRRRQASQAELLDVVGSSESQLQASLACIDARAKGEVKDCVRDVMLAVMLSPFRSADLLIVLHRNARMVLRVARLYNSRPTVREQVKILSDVVSTLAAVNLLNFGEKFIESLTQRVPGLNAVAGDMAQGIGAGLLTSAAGHAAIHRCRAFRGWGREEAQRDLASASREFVADVRSIYRSDVAPHLRAVADDVTDAVLSALDVAWAGMMGNLVVPVRERGSGLAVSTVTHGKRLWMITKAGGSRAWSATKRLRRRGSG